MSSPHASCPTHVPLPRQQLLPRLSRSSPSPTPNMELLTPSLPGHTLLLITEGPALGGLRVRGVDNLAQEEDALGVGGKDHHEEGPVEPQDSAIVLRRHEGGKAASGHCRLGTNLIHFQNGFVQTLGRKSPVLPLRERESGHGQGRKSQRSLELNTAGHYLPRHLLGISPQECLHWRDP